MNIEQTANRYANMRFIILFIKEEPELDSSGHPVKGVNS